MNMPEAIGSWTRKKSLRNYHASFTAFQILDRELEEIRNQ